MQLQLEILGISDLTLDDERFNRQYLFQAPAEAFKHLLHVAVLIHRDDAAVVLLIHPHQERLLIVMPARNITLSVVT